MAVLSEASRQQITAEEWSWDTIGMNGMMIYHVTIELCQQVEILYNVAQFKASNTEQKTTFGKLFHRRPLHTALLIIKGVV